MNIIWQRCPYHRLHPDAHILGVSNPNPVEETSGSVLEITCEECFKNVRDAFAAGGLAGEIIVGERYKLTFNGKNFEIVK